jgi:hypothetical protein
MEPASTGFFLPVYVAIIRPGNSGSSSAIL